MTATTPKKNPAPRTLRDVGQAIKERRDFTVGNVSAKRFTNGLPEYATGPRGWTNPSLPTPEAGARYIVWSYGTPIGWIDRHGVAYVTPENFSVSTSRHVSIVSSALTDDEGGRKCDKERARKRYAKIRSEYLAEAARQRAERKAIMQRYRREDARREREEARKFQAESEAAIASIVQGTPMPPVVLGIEGEVEAIESILAVRDARVTRSNDDVTHA